MRRPSRTRDVLLAGLVGVVIALAVGAGAAGLLRAASQQSLPILEEATEASAETVGRAVADEIGRALGYGIPLDRLYAVDRYFQTIVAGSPIVKALALRGTDGQVVVETAPAVEGVAFPVLLDGAEAATLVLAIAPPLVGQAIDRLRLALACVSILAGLIGGVVAHLYLTHHVAAGRRRLDDRMRAAIEGRYELLPPGKGRGAVATAFRAYDTCIAGLMRSAHTLEDAVATVKAIDFDGSLSRRVQPIVEPVSAVMAVNQPVAGPSEARRSEAGAWIAVVVVGIYAISAPFVANFAIDRDWTHVSEAWWPVLPIAAVALAAAAGFLLARLVAAGAPGLVAAGGLAMSAVAVAAVAWTRDYIGFLELRALAGAGLGVALTALLPAGARRFAGTAGIVLFTGLLAGPMVGGLLGEAIGRRMTFLVAGCLLFAMMPAVLSVARDGAATMLPETSRRRRFASAAAICAGGVSVGTLLVELPAGPGYDDYVTGALMFATVGMAAWLLPLRSLVAGALLTAAGLAIATNPGLHSAAVPGGLLLMGAGLRGLASARRARMGDAVVAASLGIATGAAAVGASSILALPQYAVAAGGVVLLGLVGALAAPRGQSDPNMAD